MKVCNDRGVLERLLSARKELLTGRASKSSLFHQFLNHEEVVSELTSSHLDRLTVDCVPMKILRNLCLIFHRFTSCSAPSGLNVKTSLCLDHDGNEFYNPSWYRKDIFSKRF